jgi:hypothetical protein
MAAGLQVQPKVQRISDADTMFDPKKQPLTMSTEIRQAGTLGLNGICYAVSEVGGAVLSVAVGALEPFHSKHYHVVEETVLLFFFRDCIMT